MGALGAMGERDQLRATALDRLQLERAQAVPPVAMRPPARRPALGAVHAADAVPAHRWLLAGPAVVLAARGAAGCQPQIEAPRCCRTVTVAPGHGVPARFCEIRSGGATEWAQIKCIGSVAESLGGKLEGGGHNHIITIQGIFCQCQFELAP
jgi:hypothetical protein